MKGFKGFKGSKEGKGIKGKGAMRHLLFGFQAVDAGGIVVGMLVDGP